MQRRILLFVIAPAALFLAPGWAAASDPSLAQNTSGTGETFEADCRVCHGADVSDRHHALYGLPIIEGSVVPYPDADGDAAPDSTYGCLSCHGASFTVVRDCVACHASPVGTVPVGAGPTEDPVMVTWTPGGGITLSWSPSCSVTDTDYAVYEGTLGNFGDHTPILCSTAGATTVTVTPPADNAYYLVVARNHWSEGSYGADGDGAQRLPSTSACLPQVIGCPWP